MAVTASKSLAEFFRAAASLTFVFTLLKQANLLVWAGGLLCLVPSSQSLFSEQLAVLEDTGLW